MKKILSFLLLIFFGISNVKAANYDIYVNAVFLDDPYYYQFKEFDDKAVMKARGNNLYANGYLVYCLEPGVLISKQYYTIDDNFLSEDVYNHISLIGYYGFNYPNHYHEYYRVATQHLIWEYFGTVRDVYITSDSDGYNRIDISGYKNEIMSLVNNHYLVPSFHNKTIIGYLGEVLAINDYNNILNTYEITNNFSNLRKENNSIYIDIKDTNDIYINLKKELPMRYTNQFYTSGGSQKLIRIGEAPIVYANLNITVLSGSIEINKLDSETESNKTDDGTLKGAVYGIYDDNKELIKELITDEEGKAYIDNLSMGKYYVQEISASEGYEIDENIYEIEISKNNLNHSVISYENKKTVIIPTVYIEMPNTFIK